MQVHAGRVLRALAIGLILAGVVALVLVGSETGWLAGLTDQKALRGIVEGWGVFGPVLIVLLLATAMPPGRAAVSVAPTSGHQCGGDHGMP